MNKYLILILLMTFLTSCGEKKNEDILLVAISPDNPPYEYMKDGEIIGFDVELIKQIAKELNKEIEFRNMPFYGILAAISTGNIDMAISGISVTELRERKVDFSDIYYQSRVAILYKKSNSFNSPEDLRNGSVATQLGTIWGQIASDMSSIYHFNIKYLESNIMLVEELKNDSVDAILLEELQAKEFTKRNPSLSWLVLEEYNSVFAIALPKGSKYLKDVNHAINSLKRDGFIKKLSKKWGLIDSE